MWGDQSLHAKAAVFIKNTAGRNETKQDLMRLCFYDALYYLTVC